MLFWKTVSQISIWLAKKTAFIIHYSLICLVLHKCGWKGNCFEKAGEDFKMRVSWHYCSYQFWTSQFLFKFCIFFILITHNSPVNFKLMHFLLGIKVLQKSPNFEFQLSSALVKICQIPHVIFQTTSQFFFKFCITL